jgi:membrane protein
LEEKNLKTEKIKNKLSINLLGKILIVLVIILVSLLSFTGIYVKDKNTYKNFIPDYKFGVDLYGYRNIVVKVNDSTETKNYDEEGNLIKETTDEDKSKIAKTIEEPVNSEESLTIDNYQAVEDTIIKRLNYLKVEGYQIKCDENTGRIYVEVPEDDNTDYIAQYCVTKGEFKILDNDTDEVLLSNADLKETKIQYSATSSGTTVFLTIEFNKDAVEKLKNISNTYVSSKDADGNDTTKKIKMTIDDETVVSTYFEEEIDNGIIQLSIGTSSDSSTLQTYFRQASNIAVLLNTNPMPLTYEIEINRFVHSDITMQTIKMIAIISAIVFALMLVYMIIKYKKNGLMGAILNIGFVALLLLAIRYGNVTISNLGILAIALSTIIEYITIMKILNIYSKKDNDKILKELKTFAKNYAIAIIPLIVLAVTFALIKWQELNSMGMVFFWGTLIMIIYNAIVIVAEREAK